MKFIRKHLSDVLLIGTFLIVAIIATVFIYSGDNNKDKIIEITIDGEIYRTFDFGNGEEYNLRQRLSTGHLFVIENGRAYIEEAPCDDELCVHQGSISESGQSIICLPERLVITVKNKSDSYDTGANDNVDWM